MKNMKILERIMSFSERIMCSNGGKNDLSSLSRKKKHLFFKNIFLKKGKNKILFSQWLILVGQFIHINILIINVLVFHIVKYKFILTKIIIHNASKMSLHSQNSFRTFVLSKKRTTIRASYTRYVHGIIICCQGSSQCFFKVGTTN